MQLRRIALSEQVTLVICGVVIGWLSLAAIVGIIVGRTIRNRDRQIPTDVQGVRPESQEKETGSPSRPEVHDTPPRGQGRTE